MDAVPEVDLSGLVDIHIHSSPDVRPRAMDDLEAARQASERGMKAILLKSHWTLTADRAYLVQRSVPGVRVFGGLALNHSVGGFNPIAVEAALRMGAAVIWMPTLSALTESKARMGPGLSTLGDDGLKQSVLEVLSLVAEHDAILATGHLPRAETMALIPAAHELGIRKIVVTHPEHLLIQMPPSEQEELRDHYGVYFERCVRDTALVGGELPFESLVDVVRRVGVDSTVISTDLGQPSKPLPVEGMAQCLVALRASGFSQAEVDRMCRLNPAMLLDL